jgi:hypothetical protein
VAARVEEVEVVMMSELQANNGGSGTASKSSGLCHMETMDEGHRVVVSVEGAEVG